MGNTIKNTFVRAVNVLSGIEMVRISTGELRDVGKLYHLEDEAEITQNEMADLGNRKISAKKEERKRGNIPKIQG